MKLRRMRLEDLNHVSKLYQDANQFTTLKNIHEWTIEGLNKFPQLNFVIEDGQKIIGAISAVLENKKCGAVNDVAVLREYQSKHVGSRLMERLLQELKRQEMEKITLWVHWKNSRAIPFYYRFGFRIKRVSQTQNIPGVPDGEDIIHLERGL